MREEKQKLVYRVAAISGRPPALFSAKIIRETEKQIVIETRRLGDAAYAFNFRTQLAPAEVAKTPAQAWHDYYSIMDATVHDLVQELQDKAALWAFAAAVIQAGSWE